MWLGDAVKKRSLRPWHTNVIQVTVWYSPCIITQYGDLARHTASFCGSGVECPTRVRKVMGSINYHLELRFWVSCLHMHEHNFTKKNLYSCKFYSMSKTLSVFFWSSAEVFIVWIVLSFSWHNLSSSYRIYLNKMSAIESQCRAT